MRSTPNEKASPDYRGQCPTETCNRFTRGLALFEVVKPQPNMGGNNPLASIDPQTLANLPPKMRESLMKQMQEEQQKQRVLEQMRRQQGRGQ